VDVGAARVTVLSPSPWAVWLRESSCLTADQMKEKRLGSLSLPCAGQNVYTAAIGRGLPKSASCSCVGRVGLRGDRKACALWDSTGAPGTCVLNGTSVPATLGTWEEGGMSPPDERGHGSLWAGKARMAEWLPVPGDQSLRFVAQPASHRDPQPSPRHLRGCSHIFPSGDHLVPAPPQGLGVNLGGKGVMQGLSSDASLTTLQSTPGQSC
jgi:hypothetical protein